MSPDAAVDPTPRPGDFDTYWSAVLKELGELPAAVAAEKIPLRSNEFSTTYGLRFTSIGPYRLFAYLSVPVGEGPFPTLIYLARYASTVEVIPQGDADEKRGRFAVLSLAARGQRNADHPWTAPFPGLLTEGIDAPRGYVFRGIVADCCRAVDVALSLPEVDESRLALLGANDLPLLTAALRPAASHAIATPDLFHRALERAAHTQAYPLEELNDYLRLFPDRRSKVAATLAYFDPIFFAPKVRATTLLWGEEPECESLSRALAGPSQLRPSEKSRYKDGLFQEEWLSRGLGFEDAILPAHWRD